MRYETYQQALEAVKGEAQRVLDEESVGSVKEAHLRMGERRDQATVHLAKEELRARLIVMGSRDLNGIRQALVGSVSASAVHHSHCPAMVVCLERQQGG